MIDGKISIVIEPGKLTYLLIEKNDLPLEKIVLNAGEDYRFREMVRLIYGTPRRSEMTTHYTTYKEE